MLVAIVSAIILQNTVYSNFLMKFFSQVVQYDASHFGKNGKILDVNSNNSDADLNQVSEKVDNNDPDFKKVEMAKIGSCRTYLIL